MAGNADCSNRHALDEPKKKVAELILILNLHLHSEEKNLLPALEAKLARSTRGNVEEHELLEKTVDQIGHFVDRLAVEAAPAEAIQFSSMVNGFHARYLDHMAMEESKMDALI